MALCRDRSSAGHRGRSDHFGRPGGVWTWSAPTNLGPLVNVNSPTAYDACPTISRDGLSLYFRTDRPGGQGDPPTFDIWVAQRDSVDDDWGTPVNLGDTCNSEYSEYCSAISPDGHWLAFVSNRPGIGSQDLWISHRKDKRDDFAWENPAILDGLNSSAQENGPAFLDDEATGQTLLYFSSGRPGGMGGLDIYVAASVGDAKNVFGPPTAVSELNSGATDYQPALRKDGLEIFFASTRAGGSGAADLWTSTRASVFDAWSAPVNLGPAVNSNKSDFHPTLSSDGTVLIFASERGGTAVGVSDLWICTREKLKDRN